MCEIYAKYSAFKTSHNGMKTVVFMTCNLVSVNNVQSAPVSDNNMYDDENGPLTEYRRNIGTIQ